MQCTWSYEHRSAAAWALDDCDPLFATQRQIDFGFDLAGTAQDDCVDGTCPGSKAWPAVMPDLFEQCIVEGEFVAGCRRVTDVNLGLGNTDHVSLNLAGHVPEVKFELRPASLVPRAAWANCPRAGESAHGRGVFRTTYRSESVAGRR